MENKAKSHIGRSPRLYGLLKRGYYAYRHIQRRLLGTRLEEKYWATAHLRKGDDGGDKNSDWARGYWDSRDHSHRDFLTERISKFSTSSVLEIGSNCDQTCIFLQGSFQTQK
jgi:hypothetical protein